MIEAQPQTPTMVIKSQREGDPNHEKHSQHGLLVQMREEQTKKVNDQNEKLSRNHVRHDRADEKAFLAFEGNVAGGAMYFDIEGPPENSSAAASGTLQLKTPPQREDDCTRISFHD